MPLQHPFKVVNARLLAPSGFFVPGFPKLMRFQEHHDRILKKMMPKLKQHLVRLHVADKRRVVASEDAS